jgi:deoxycytidine triphosphate deaminase
MTVLSERELTGQLGKGILLHPLKPGTIEACNICLTASEYAYAIGKEERLPIKTEVNLNKPNDKKKFFEIPPNDTTLVSTDEAIWLSSDLCSTVHSTVKLVSKGIGHIGTRVNPLWHGVLCIAFHNLSDSPCRMYVQDTTKPIAYLIVHNLSSKSSISNMDIDVGTRMDVLKGYKNTEEIYEWYNNGDNTWMTTNKIWLKQLMLESPEYRKYRKLKSGRLRLWISSYIGSDPMTTWTAVIAFTSILALVLSIINALAG